MSHENLKAKYSIRYDSYLLKMAADLENHLKDSVGSYPHIDRICARAKTIERFCKKAENKEKGKLRYSDPLNQIQDQLAVRIVTFYLKDVEKISKIIEKYYRPIERQHIIPDSEKEFGYQGKHYIMFVPDEILPQAPRGSYPKFFELQIKTLFQHAWAEASHDLEYKPSNNLKAEDKRKVAFTAAQAWGADRIFEELNSTNGKRKNKRL